MSLSSLVVPALLAAVAAIGLGRRVDVYGALTHGAEGGLTVRRRSVPSLVGLWTAVGMFRASGAMAVATGLVQSRWPDSYVGRVAAVMLGSTETTFYTIAVYFGSAGIHRTRHAIPAALAADLTGFAASALAVRLFFGP